MKSIRKTEYNILTIETPSATKSIRNHWIRQNKGIVQFISH